MVVKWTVFLAGVAAFLNIVAARAQQPELVIRQVSVHLPYISAYVDVPAQNGRPLRLQASDISAVAIQGHTVKLEDMRVSHSFAYTFLLDVSGSMTIRKEVVNAIVNWIDQLPPDDHVELFAFGETYREIGNPTSSRAALISGLKTLRSGDQKTNLYLALERGIMNAERTDASLPEGRLIILLTDGKNEGDNGGISEAKLHEDIRNGHVPIYAVGHTRLGATEQDIYLGKMKAFAEESGGFYDCGGTLTSVLCRPNASLKESFERLSARMNGLFVVQMKCDSCQESDNHDLQITLTNGSTGRIPVALAILPVPAKTSPVWLYIVGTLLLLVVLVLVWFVFRKQPQPQIAVEVPPQGEVPQQESGLPAHITIVSGPAPGQVFQFKLLATVVIGRDPGCEVILPDDKEISSRHCELIRTGNRVEISDLGSLNGTLLNGAHVVARQRVEDGDLIRVGRTEFRVRFKERA